MPVVEHLCCFALKQFGGEGLDAVAKILTDRYSDHGKLLLNALDRANRRAWRSLQWWFDWGPTGERECYRVPLWSPMAVSLALLGLTRLARAVRSHHRACFGTCEVAERDGIVVQ